MVDVMDILMLINAWCYFKRFFKIESIVNTRTNNLLISVSVPVLLMFSMALNEQRNSNVNWKDENSCFIVHTYFLDSYWFQIKFIY